MYSGSKGFHYVLCMPLLVLSLIELDLEASHSHAHAFILRLVRTIV